MRGTLEPPEGALVLALDRASVGWLQRSVRSLGEAAPSLDRCLSERARGALAEARNVNHIPRGLYACLVRALAARQPELIAFDVNFNVEKPEDDVLAGAIREAGNVLLLEKVSVSALEPAAEARSLVVRLHPVETLRQAALGLAGFQVDGWAGQVTTAYLRRFPDFPDLGALPEDAWMRLHGRALPAGERRSATQPLWLYGPPGTVPTWFLRDVFDAGSTRPLPDTLQGTVVFIGASDPTNGTIDDHFRIPAIRGERSLIGGVELAATAYLNLLHDERMRAPSSAAGALVMLALGLGLAGAALLLPAPRDVFGVVGLTLGYALLASLCFSSARLWLPVAVPVMLAMPAAVLMALESRYRLASGLVARLVPRQFAERLLRSPGSERVGTEIEQATILFTDVAASTSLGERMPDAEFSELMMEYYERATGAVEDHGGMVVDYRGDGVLAVFTESVAGRDHASLACRAALDICARMHQSAAADARETERQLQLRMGLNSASVASGTVGARDRFNYNVLGDGVNIAARLEDLGKIFGGDGRDVIIVSEMTRKGAALPDDCFESLGNIRLRGRQSTTPVYRLRAPDGGP